MSDLPPEKFPWELDASIPAPAGWVPGTVKAQATTAPGTVLPPWTTSGPAGSIVQGVGAVRPEGVGPHQNSWGNKNADDEKPKDVLEGRARPPQAVAPVELTKPGQTAQAPFSDGKMRARP